MLASRLQRIHRLARAVAVAIVAITAASLIVLSVRAFAIMNDRTATDQLQRLRETTYAVFDLQRVITTSEDYARVAADPERPGEAAFRDLAAAVDLVYVRIDVFGALLRDIDSHTAQRLAATLDEFIAFADATLQEGIPNPDAFHDEVLSRARAVQRAVLHFYDEENTRYVKHKEDEHRLLALMTLATALFMLTSASVGLSTLRFWRREAINRVEREQSVAEAHYYSKHDILTGLLNRDTFASSVDTLIERTSDLALIIVDIDALKAINDVHGQSAGDALIKDVALSLEAEFADTRAIIGRLGGDEFAIAMATTSDQTALLERCRQTLAAIASPLQLGPLSIRASASIGLAMGVQIELEGPVTRSKLMHSADLALYQAKQRGMGQVEAYARPLAERVAARKQLEIDLPRGLARGEFFVVYQPQMSLADGGLHGFEALVRWRRNGEVVPPSGFIPVAEETGSIVDIDLWVLRTAVAEAARWHRQRADAPQISVNLTACHLQGSAIVDAVRQVLLVTDLPARRLTLEITESVKIEDWEAAQATLCALSELGVELSLDDFGTGYSNLSYLHQLNVHEVKLDRSFLTEVESSRHSRFMLDGLVEMVAALSMRLVVEGVEAPGQLSILRQLNCHVVQGYLLGAPMSAEEARALATSPDEHLKLTSGLA
ncbi:MAG: bifunctional diguanylate cyclase/phosphodiesterase [Pseudomonadota bacterium]